MFFFYKVYQVYYNFYYKEKKKLVLKKSFLQLFRSDFLVIFAIKISFYILNIISLIIFRGKIYNISLEKQKKILLIFINKFYFLSKKIDEVINAVIIIQSENFNENTKISNFSEYNTNKVYDFIVIGSGPGGSISSYYLNKRFNGNGLLIEKGRAFNLYKSKHPGDEFLYKWKNGGVNSTILPLQVQFASGECLGGGSEINSGLYHKPDQDFISKWKKNDGIVNLEINELKEKLSELEKIINFTKEFDKNKTGSHEFFLKGAKEKNYSTEEVPIFQTINDNNKESTKNTMSNSFIKKYLEEGGKLLTKFNVKNIQYVNNKWIVRGKKNTNNVQLKCKYLFLSCGAINTGKLLIRSKIKLKNKVNTFKFHPMIKVIAKFPQRVQEGHENVHPFQITKFYPDFIIGHASSGKRFLNISTYQSKEISNDINKNWNNMSIYHSTFSIGNGNYFKLIFSQKFLTTYSINNKEFDKVKKGLIIMCETLFNGGAEYIYLLNKKIEKVQPNDFKKKILNIKNLRDIKFSSVHILGGINCGENKNCTVNSYGEVFGNKDLYINDSSLINANLLKNPQGTIMAITKRNIDNFLNNN